MFLTSIYKDLMTDSQKIKKLQNKLWSAADKLWSNSELKPSEYTMPVLGLIFFKHASVKFDQTKQELEEKSSFGRRSIGKEDYQAQGVLYLPEKAHYSYLVNLKESEEL
ncbi:MAG: type I restriction-modification system subunit M N-terminal domain-containing protein, partial [Patescibacteria group bacterium]|nr:type I restriction-modification system subunit M N-terminal domain-containing protein [Patescibacteria group bacterium]